MNDVPLIQRTDVNSINTSIIAIKKQLKQIEQMLGGIGETELPTDILYRKDIADAVQEGNNNPVSSGAVDEAIKSLDVSSVGGSGKYISAIEEVDGKINATASNLATSVSNSNTNAVTSKAVYSAIKTAKDNVQKVNALFNEYTETSSDAYLKVSGISGSQNVYFLQAREGEIYLISTGFGDTQISTTPLIRRLLNKYTKIKGFTWKDGILYIKYGAYSHKIILSQICGDTKAVIDVSIATATEYNAGTAISIVT